MAMHSNMRRVRYFASLQIIENYLRYYSYRLLYSQYTDEADIFIAIPVEIYCICFLEVVC